MYAIYNDHTYVPKLWYRSVYLIILQVCIMRSIEHLEPYFIQEFFLFYDLHFIVRPSVCQITISKR